MAYVLGIDVGSGYSKAVVCDDTAIRSHAVMPSGSDYKEVAKAVVQRALDKAELSLSDIAFTVATGYGAGMVDFADRSVTDISCHGIGIYHFFPSVRTVIDVGTQYSKVIRLDDRGKIRNFIMNEKCAGGSGKFLQVAARILHISLEEISDISLTSQNPVEFTTACAVFAESEAVSRIAEGAPPADILAGIHKAMASKLVNLVARLGRAADYAITGGGAKDLGLVKMIREEITSTSPGSEGHDSPFRSSAVGSSTEEPPRILVPDEPQITAAFGAALLASGQVPAGQE